jgi:3-oxoacyl-[acyl-carrier protein] reductase
MPQHKIALVTGASKGIGAAIAVALAQDGFDIWLNYRSDHDAANAVAGTIRGLGRACTPLPFDVSDSAAVKTALAPMLERETPFVLVNNAGHAKDGILAMMDEKDWRDVLAVHLDGFFLVTKPVLFAMLQKRAGRIVNIVSTSGQSGMGGQTNYSAAKGGIIAATKSLALEVAKRNILVNAVSPGFIETDMTRDIPKERILPFIPLGRIGRPEEVAGIVSFLCSDRATYVTGQVIAVNGGAYM